MIIVIIIIPGCDVHGFALRIISAQPPVFKGNIIIIEKVTREAEGKVKTKQTRIFSLTEPLFGSNCNAAYTNYAKVNTLSSIFTGFKISKFQTPWILYI